MSQRFPDKVLRIDTVAAPIPELQSIDYVSMQPVAVYQPPLIDKWTTPPWRYPWPSMDHFEEHVV